MAIAGTIPAAKGYLNKADWRFIQNMISQMKWYENWEQKQEALRTYATSYEQSKKFDDYGLAIENGIHLYTDYDELAKLLSNGDKKFYQLLLANQNAFDNLINYAICKHDTIENSFKRVMNSKTMIWVLLFSLLGLITIWRLKKYYQLIDYYHNFFAAVFFIIFAFLTYLYAGPATLGSPRRIYSGLQKALAKEATHRYSESIFFYTIYYQPTYQVADQYQKKLDKAKTLFVNYEKNNNDIEENTISAQRSLDHELPSDLEAEIMAHGRIHKAYHDIKSFYDKQNLESYYALHPERKPKERRPIPMKPTTTTLHNIPPDQFAPPNDCSKPNPTRKSKRH